MYRAIIFDLDNCLSPGNAVGRQLLQPVFSAIHDNNDGHFSDVEMAAIDADLWRLPLPEICDKYGFPPAMRNETWEAYSQLEVSQPMQGYQDLGILPELSVMRFLVTTGFRRFQESKIRCLGIGTLFTDIRVDALDEPGEKGKQRLFAEIIGQYGLSADQVMVVGDNAAAEIAAGNNLGLTTVQILRPGVPRGDNAGHYVESLAELRPLIYNSSVA